MNKEKNYIMYKKGYKHMLEDIEYAKINISKFKRGLSVFEDKQLREHLLTNTAAPLISSGHLRQSLQDVVLAHDKHGPQTSIQKLPVADMVMVDSPPDLDFDDTYSNITRPVVSRGHKKNDSLFSSKPMSS